MMSTYGERLREAMARAGMTQDELAQAAGLRQQSIQYLLTKGRGSRYNSQIAKALRVNPDWLATGQNDLANVADPGTQGRDVPIISWIQAGEWDEAVDNYQPGDAENWIRVRPGKVARAKHVYALVVQGDSMHNPNETKLNFPPGCYIYVDPTDRNPSPGQLVVAKLKKQDTVTFKQFKIEDGRPYLKPLNPDFKPIFDEFCVIGRVIGRDLFDEY